MDPIKAIADITGHVLIRIGNAILGNDTADSKPEVHYHFHISQADRLDKPEDKARGFTRPWRR